MNKEFIERQFKKNTRTAREDWSFAGERSIDRWTHGYHRYPAKFLPQLVKKIIESYACSTDLIGDVFAGCGTTLIESKAHGLNSVGVDINPVAHLIAKAKTNPVPPELLKQSIFFIISEIKNYEDRCEYFWDLHDRIDFWFRPVEKNKIAFLYHLVDQFEIECLRNYFFCALSNILKNSSRWLQSGTKPQVDPKKEPVDPLVAFSKQILRMEPKNREFYELLRDNAWLEKSCRMILADAKQTTIESESVSTIVTSPPYVTSYEYADIHQLTGYWFNYFSELTPFRKKFIGTFHSNIKSNETKGEFANSITSQLAKTDKKLSYEVANYFNDMDAVIVEMKRILKPGGTVCLVIGNTTMKEVRIKAAESFTELLFNHGFDLIDLIKRRINHKFMPTVRDRNSGKFTNLESQNSRKIYPEEYIIIARKKNNEHFK